MCSRTGSHMEIFSRKKVIPKDDYERLLEITRGACFQPSDFAPTKTKGSWFIVIRCIV